MENKNIILESYFNNLRLGIMSTRSSEKYIERKLVEGIKKQGGECIKLLASHLSGLPDRLCLLPGGKLFFVEVKSEGKQPTTIQKVVHQRLKGLGFNVEVVDNMNQLNQLIQAL